jgi:hypothetical protein
MCTRVYSKREEKKRFYYLLFLDQSMMCDNLSLYKSYIPSPTSLPPTQSTTMAPQFYAIDNDDDEHRPYMSVKRKFSGI